jgi:hypothetical protein
MEPRTAALAALVRAVGLEKTVFPDRPAKQTRERLAALSQANWTADAVRKAVQAMEDALLAITTATAVTAATSAAVITS